ncbi:MAG: bifunctional diguanylate cyclase/phosphodiesterase [Steroidobacteraceae bacterium]
MTETNTEGYERLMQFLYRAPIGLVQMTAVGDIEMINPMAANLLMPLSHAGNLDNLFVVLGNVAPQLPGIVGAFAEPSGDVCESMRLPLAAGGNSQEPQILSLSIVKLEEARFMAMISDVTQEVQQIEAGVQRRLLLAGRTDTLTQMPNRIAACELLQQAMTRTSLDATWELALLFINCDRFKHINDIAGHAIGDEVLGLMASRLLASLRQRARNDRVVHMESVAARVGGDEFVVILTDLQAPDDVHTVARRLLDVLGRSYSIKTHQFHCTVSIGVVLQANLAGDTETALQHGRVAMLEAKRFGGGQCVVFEPEMQERAARRSGMESALRRAIAEEELFVMYQPVVRLVPSETGRPVVDRSAGVEALVRWLHPTRGVVSPVEFIAAAEEFGLIGALGTFVLETACHQFVSWRQELGSCAPRLLAVNLSRGQLADPAFIVSIEGILQRSGMPPQSLQLEITESLAAQDESVQAKLRELKALGLTLALDDFGTGYSSLASLHLLPVDTIKIDRSFVTDVVTSLHHRVLIEATVRVAKNLGMGTVAEGIETAEQAAIVCLLGCEKGQGYFFGRPLLAANLAQWAKAGVE